MVFWGSLTFVNPNWYSRAMEVLIPACSQPFRYKIGLIDPRFEISESELKKDILEAEAIWEKEYGKELFSFDPEAKFSVNMVFDERQDLKNQVEQIKDKLDNDKAQIEPSEAEYNSRTDSFRKRLAELNSRIEYWNSQGGAPAEEYEKLIKEQDELKKEVATINLLAEKLNKSAEAYNMQVGELKETAKNFNQVLESKPEEGLFDPQNYKIDIYLTDSKEELIHTLAHELGHALGMGHTGLKNSIMYPQTNQGTKITPEDAAELKRVCKNAVDLPFEIKF